jgi:hypothetical protein
MAAVFLLQSASAAEEHLRRDRDGEKQHDGDAENAKEG